MQPVGVPDSFGVASDVVPGAALSQLADGTVLAGALRAALDSGLLAHLDAVGGDTAPAAATALGLDPRAAMLVLDALAHGGLVQRRGAMWTMSVPVEALWMFQETPQLIGELLRSGAPAFRLEDPSVADRLYASSIDVVRGFSEELVARLAPELARPGLRVLEVACGLAPWGCALRRHDTSVSVVALDLPGVIARTRSAVEAAGLASGFRFVAGDVLEVSLEGSFDLVIVAGLCRLLAASTNTRLFRRVAGWCRPGGELVVVDAIDTAVARERGLALYALSLATRTASGRPWPAASYGRWLRDAGFSGIEITPTEHGAMTVLRARREP